MPFPGDAFTGWRFMTAYNKAIIAFISETKDTRLYDICMWMWFTALHVVGPRCCWDSFIKLSGLPWVAWESHQQKSDNADYLSIHIHTTVMCNITGYNLWQILMTNPKSISRTVSMIQYKDNKQQCKTMIAFVLVDLYAFWLEHIVCSL